MQRKDHRVCRFTTKIFCKKQRYDLRARLCTASFDNACQDFIEEHFPVHTSTLWRFEDSDPLFFGPKWDDFWSIERLCAIQSQRVYRNPRPTHIKGVVRRLREEVKKTDPKTLTRLVHALPAKMNEIYRLKGKKIPSNFDPRKSSHACKCSVCES